MARAGMGMEEALGRLGAWGDWVWDGAWGEWGLDVGDELEEGRREEGWKRWVFAGRWREIEGVWGYVGAR